MIDALRNAVTNCSAPEVEHEIHELSFQITQGPGRVPDEIAEEILALLNSENMFDSDMAAHLLNFFQFESGRISKEAKLNCRNFLIRHGNRFTHVHSAHVVAELMEDGYLD